MKIYRLVTRNSYEREMFDRASRKLGLERAVLGRLESSGSVADEEASRMPTLTRREVEELLKRGAYGALMDDEEANKFCEEGQLTAFSEGAWPQNGPVPGVSSHGVRPGPPSTKPAPTDIDTILERRTVVINHDAPAEPGAERQPSLFSKASFSAAGATQSSDLDVDDPDFWVKWAKVGPARYRRPPDPDCPQNKVLTVCASAHRRAPGGGSQGANLDVTSLVADDVDDLILNEPRQRKYGFRLRRIGGPVTSSIP